MHRAICHPTVLPGLDAFTFLSDRTFPRHTHDEFGFGAIIRGGQESWSGRGTVEAGEGDVITVNPGELHDGVGCPGQPRLWHMVYLTPKLIGQIASVDVRSMEFDKPVVGASTLNRIMTGAIEAILAERPDRNRIEEALVHVIGLLQAGGGETERMPTRHSGAVSRVRERIHDEVGQPLSLAALAETAGLSRFQTLRRFRAEIGATPHAYLTQQRVKTAKGLIDSGVSLAQAALGAGFADQSHMTRAFARQLGVSPGAYRRARSV